MFKEENNPRNFSHLLRDLAIIALTIVATIFLSNLGVIDYLLELLGNSVFWGGIVAGLFFVSVFTAAPAVAFILKLVEISSPWEVAFFGSLGALIGDLLILRFFEKSLIEDILNLLSKRRRERLVEIFRSPFLKWFLFFAGALIIASPLPDEIGLALMGFSKVKKGFFVVLSLLLNFLGLLVISLILKG
ncbi:MAG: hypothetical protein KatS3mg098_445 [Candidatus Parcubacteria bacterium]|nr:MAG: hypothetical protein KatS3mg098_445 [Candidatus Parcubacteria bacterium]